MGIYDELIGYTEPSCPHCGAPLAKMPARKTQCQNCRNYICVRTRPQDRQRVIVTEAQAVKIEEQWERFDNQIDQSVVKRKPFAVEKDKMTTDLKQKPAENDVRLSLLAKQLKKHARQLNMEFYRNAKFEMAETLKMDGKLEESFTTYLEVCYMDINSPRNINGMKQLSPFAPKEANIPPGMVGRAQNAMKKLDLGEATVKELFIIAASANQKILKAPVAPEEAWEKLRPYLFGE